jgi:hypothetical protein
MPEVVHAELEFVTVLRETGRGRHDPRVAHQHVEPVRLGEDALGGGLDGCERGEVAGDEDDVRVGDGGLDAVDDTLRTGSAPPGEVDRGGVVLCDLEDGLSAEPRGACRDVNNTAERRGEKISDLL